MTTIPEILEKIKETSAEFVIKDAIKKAHDNSSYNALITIIEERALQRAKDVDAGKIKGKLAGVPFVAKDNIFALGGPTTTGSKMLEEFNAPMQATVIERLEAQGAICIGKSNLDAFAHGGTTENELFGSTRNAVDKSRVAGGSSGGSAVVTALGIVPFALGSDTGGSIRQPASHNGAIGIKPTYGMVSRYGVVAMAASMDTVGVLVNNISDGEIVLGIIAGQDSKDMITMPDYFKPESEPGKTQKIGIIKELMADDSVSDEVKSKTEDYIGKLRAKGHVVEEISLPMAKYTPAISYIVTAAESCSSLARYDGVRYTHRSKDAKTLTEIYSKSRAEGFTLENKRRIIFGSLVLSSEYYDKYYLKAQKVKTLLVKEFNELFKVYDFLICPAVAITASELGKSEIDPVKVYSQNIMTKPASLAGLPAVSVPASFDKDGLPIGVQLIGPRKSDAKMFALIKTMEAK